MYSVFFICNRFNNTFVHFSAVPLFIYLVPYLLYYFCSGVNLCRKSRKNGAGNVAIWDKFSEQHQHKSYNLSYNDLTLGAVSVSYSQSRS